MSGPEDNPADEIQPTKEDWEAFAQRQQHRATDLVKLNRIRESLETQAVAALSAKMKRVRRLLSEQGCAAVNELNARTRYLALNEQLLNVYIMYDNDHPNARPNSYTYPRTHLSTNAGTHARAHARSYPRFVRPCCWIDLVLCVVVVNYTLA